MHIVLRRSAGLLALLRAMAPLYHQREPLVLDLVLQVRDGCLQLLAGTTVNWAIYDLIPDDVLSEGSCMVRASALLRVVESVRLRGRELLELKTEGKHLVVTTGETLTVALNATPVPPGHHFPRPRSVVAFRANAEALRAAFIHLAQARSETMGVPMRLLGMRWLVEADRLVLTSCANFVLARASVPIARGEAAGLAPFLKGLTVLPTGIGLLNQLAKAAVNLAVPELVFTEPAAGTVTSCILGTSHGGVGAHTSEEPWPAGLPDTDAPGMQGVTVHTRDLVPALDNVLALSSEVNPASCTVWLEGGKGCLRLLARGASDGAETRATIPTRELNVPIPVVGVNGTALLAAVKAIGKDVDACLSPKGRNLLVTDVSGARRVLLAGTQIAPEPWKIWISGDL